MTFVGLRRASTPPALAPSSLIAVRFHSDKYRLTQIKRQWVFKFLAGLRDEYNQVRYHILNIDPVPSLREAFVIIQNEESRRDVMLPTISSEQSTLLSVPQYEHRNQCTHHDFGYFVGSDDKDKLHCDYCQRPHHTRETCWRLHGQPSTQGRGVHSGSASGHGGSSHARHTVSSLLLQALSLWPYLPLRLSCFTA
ncbi:hypothetical protein Acr_25g0002500 [Actinidia rufa]|uniref:Uncharacterized protein n=1 Tax=Actinidia rufa TaxID=165716 RepID=A0A7J0GYI9_9ERIC|nr:hypothetical protein Acr_25g0002500 [Actinidia rufa]